MARLISMDYKPIPPSRKTHGLSGAAEYRVWASMKARCYIKSDTNYKRYGSRGIEVEARWHAFDKFYKDMGPRPSPRHTIERIDSLGNYGPGNCYWATRQEQNNNKSDTRMVRYEGEAISVANLARQIGMPYAKLKSRIKRGWTVERAVGQK